MGADTWDTIYIRLHIPSRRFLNPAQVDILGNQRTTLIIFSYSNYKEEIDFSKGKSRKLLKSYLI